MTPRQRCSRLRSLQDAVGAFSGYTLEDAKGSGAPKKNAKPKPAPAEKPKKEAEPKKEEEPKPAKQAAPAPAAPAKAAPAKGAPHDQQDTMQPRPLCVLKHKPVGVLRQPVVPGAQT